eukprot:1027864-Amphidinium_carterae.2
MIYGKCCSLKCEGVEHTLASEQGRIDKASSAAPMTHIHFTWANALAGKRITRLAKQFDVSIKTLINCERHAMT